MFRGTKWFALVGTAALVAGLIGCATVSVSSDYDPGTDFSKYKTFSLLPIEGLDSITAGRIQSSVVGGLKARGLQQAEGNTDLKVIVQARMSKEKHITSTGYGYGGYGYRGWGGGMSTSTATVQDVAVGTLIVDLVDDSAKKLVWRGIASDTLNPDSKGEQKQRALDEAMRRLFLNFPPAPKK